MNKNFNNNNLYFAVNNQYGTITYICPDKNTKKNKQICYKETCCNYIYRNPQPVIIPFTPFIMTFVYTSPERFPTDLFEEYIPILSSQQYINYVYTINPAVPSKNDTVTLTVHFKFTDNEVTTDGLYFKPDSKTFWNIVTTNINIINFGKIPLSRTTGQFSDLNSISFSAPDAPTININTNLTNCFKNCLNFNSYIGNWDTTYVTDMSYMFYNCIAFNQFINSLDTTNVNYMSYMFYNCQSFNQYINDWNTSNVFDMSYMFYNNINFNQPLSKWNTANVTDMSYMFNYAVSFNQNIDNFDVSKVTNIEYMFSNASAFNNGDTSNIGGKPLKFVFSPLLSSIQSLFESANSFNQNVGYNPIYNYWNTTNITNMANLFKNASIFNYELNWNTSNVTNMNSMFFGAKQFNNGVTGNIAGKPLNFDTSSVQNMSFMFFDATNFNQNLPTDPIKIFNVSNVLFMDHMFTLASNFNNGDINNNYSKPLYFNLNPGLTSLANMFQNATSFNQSISTGDGNWNTQFITNMSYTFYNATVFNNGQDIDATSNTMDWVVSQVENLVVDPSDPDIKAPLYFSVGSALTYLGGAGNSPFNYDGNPIPPILTYNDYGRTWIKLPNQPTPNGSNWIDIATNFDGKYVLVIAYTPASIWTDPGLYVSNNYGITWTYIGGYTFNSIFYNFTNSYFYSCSVSTSGQYQAVMIKPGDDGEQNTNYLFLSNNYGVSWYKQSIPAIFGFNDISALSMSGTGEFIFCGNLGVGSSTVYTIGKNYGTVWNYYTLTTTQLATIYSVGTNITGRYMAAYYNGPSNIPGQIYNAIAVSADYGSTWPNIFTFTGNLGNILNNGFKHMLSMSSDGDVILFTAGNTSFLSTNFGVTFTSITSTFGFLSTITYNGNYSLATSTATNQILVNKNFGASGSWFVYDYPNPSTPFVQIPVGLCTSYYGQYSYLILNTTNTTFNGIYRSVTS